MTIADLLEKVISPGGYNFAPNAVNARLIGREHVEDAIIDVKRFTPVYKLVPPDKVLRVGDLLIALSNDFKDRQVNGVGIYHPDALCMEPLAGKAFAVVYRPINLYAGVSILAELIRLPHQKPLIHNLAKHPVTLLGDKQARLFLETIIKTARLKENYRKQTVLMSELLPSLASQLIKEGQV